MLKPPTGEKTTPVIGDNRGGRPKPLASRKELRMIMLGVFALIFVIAWFASGRGQIPDGIIEPIPPKPIAPMGRPDWASLQALPDAAEIAGSRAQLEDMLSQGHVPSVALGVDGSVLAWGERLAAEDVERRRIPQRVQPEELVRDDLRAGQLITLTARLDHLADAPVTGRDQGYRWVGLALDQDQYALGLAPDDGTDLILNGRVRVLGRYLGRTLLGTATGDAQVPFLSLRVVNPLGDEVEEDHGLAAFQGQAIVTDDLYQDLDDDLPIIETRPYYITLGRMKAEFGTPELMEEPADGNRVANDLHQAPAEHRGRLVTVRGLVYHAWEDPQVAKDHPFDVRRVVRIQLYKRDWGPITEDGETRIMSVLRIFEVACITDQPLPKAGDYLGVTGRFLKWRAIPVDKHPELDRLLGVKRQSNTVYTCFIVGGPWRVEVIETVDMTPLVILLSVGGVCFALFVLWFVNRDRGAERRLQESVRALRQRRRSLRNQATAAESPAPGTDDSADGKPTLPG